MAGLGLVKKRTKILYYAAFINLIVDFEINMIKTTNPIKIGIAILGNLSINI